MLPFHLFLLAVLYQMGMSPSRMPQTQGMMGNHANNMVTQPANQNQFLPQGQFSAAAGGAMNVNVGLGQPITQPAGTQVRRLVLCCADRNASDALFASCSFPFEPGPLSVTRCMLTVHPSLFQQPQNSNLPLNALGSLSSQLPCGPAAQTTLRATPPPNTSVSLQPQQQHHASAQAPVPPRTPTPASAGGPSSTPTHVPSSLPGPPSSMSTPPEPSLPLTPLQPQTEPPSQMQQPTSVQAQHPSTPVRYHNVTT